MVDDYPVRAAGRVQVVPTAQARPGEAAARPLANRDVLRIDGWEETGEEKGRDRTAAPGPGPVTRQPR